MILDSVEGNLLGLTNLFSTSLWKGTVRKFFEWKLQIEQEIIKNCTSKAITDFTKDGLNLHIIKRNLLIELLTDLEESLLDFSKNSPDSSTVHNKDEV